MEPLRLQSTPRQNLVTADPPSSSQRTVTGILNPTTPLSFEGNTSLWFTVSQLTGKGNDLLGKRLHWDKSPLGRATLFGTALYANWAATYYSHEVAHTQIYGYYHMNPEYNFDEEDWSRLIPKLDLGCKDNTNKECRDNEIVNALHLRRLVTLHGLAQQKLNARYQLIHNITSPTFSFDEGIAYFFNTTADQWYLFGDTLEIHHAFGDKGDVSKHLDKKNSTLTRKKWLISSGLATFASFHAWETFFASARYLSKGEREQTAGRLKLKPIGIDIIPPAFQTIPMPHPGGLYIEGILPVRNLLRSGEWCFLDAGSDINNAAGKRMGLNFLGWNPFATVKGYIPMLDAGFHYTRHAEGKYKNGFALQGGLRLRPLPRTELTLNFLHASRDLLENQILGKGDFTQISPPGTNPVFRAVPQSTEVFLGLNFALP